ncbi:NUDIX domain-containing protein [Micromonospora endophytica]|uniref:NUDIX hydrolase n=1 Tax=Micromonospora endophytica TaxID=515350 RepID=A0A2W2CFV7_9ACTN|nr:NUDIX domain-containing protein [Micromonospora endophytica]PZF98291.1 NUDIX hydrolase [Micromonospora endophytica]RIW42743.1 NUDIX domain-containing protein [Micromonospora endophytica]BCJ62766.1 NUDIX hydrolase [Micromonospora endophytica]
MTERPPYLVERNRGYFEYQLPISVKLVVDYHGRVPLLRNERDEWELPGGKLEVGETPEETVCREVAEELGLTIVGVDIIDTWVYEITRLRHVFIVSYGARYAGKEQLAYSAEHKELGLFGYEKVPALPMPEPYKQTIARWQERLRTADAGGFLSGS